MSEEALRLIHEEKKERTGKLDLSGKALTEIPKEVFELTWLEWLYIKFEHQNGKSKQGLFYVPDSINDLKKLISLGIRCDADTGIVNLLDFDSEILLPHLDRLSLNAIALSNQVKFQFFKDIEHLSLTKYPDRDFSFLNNLDKLKFLFFYECHEIPTNHLVRLQKLNTLICLQSPLTNIHHLPKLQNITHLQLQLAKSENPEHLKYLLKLRSLTLIGSGLTNIEFLRNLFQLSALSLSHNKINDISPIQKLIQLEEIDLSNNNIVEFSPLLDLPKLSKINIGKNDALNDLTNLIPIIKRNNLDVHLEHDDFYQGQNGLYLNNPIQTPPLEIVKQGREAILEWFEANKAKLNEVKLILIGDPKAGKTSLLRRLKDGSFDANEPQTDGINIEDIAFDSCPTFPEESNLKDITGHFWDFGGQEIMNSTHQFFLTNRSVYILVLNARNDKQVSNQIRNWVQRIQATGGNSAIIVVANQIDVNPGFGFENVSNLKEEFPQIKGFLKVSCLDGKNIKQLVTHLEEWIPKAEMFETEIDERWLPIKKQLEEETKGEKNKKKGRYLDEPRFHEICESHGLDSSTSQESLVKFLHDLGLLLHFEGIRENLSEYYVLDPYWITYGVYQILTSKYAGECKGIVPIDQLDYIVNEEPDKSQVYQPKHFEKIKYSPNQRRFLVDILHEFKLCFYVNNRQHIIIPDLLETNAPVEITESFRKSTQALRFVYQYTYIPSSIIPQIMVEAHGMLEHIWRTGCILSHDGSRAMINAYQNQILIIVDGEVKKKREFMSIIRYLIDQINGKLSDPPKMLIPLPNLPNEFVSYKKLRSLEKRGERTYIHFSEVKDEEYEYSVSELLEGIAPIQQDLKLLEEVQELKAMMQAGATKLDIIHEHQMEHYAYLRTNLPPDWDERLLDEITSLQIEQTDEIRQDLIEALAKTFELHKGDMDEQLKEIYLKMTEPKSLTSLKLKAGLPLLASMVPGLPEIPDVPGIPKVSVEAEFDLKGWSEKMYKKYELELFKVMGKIG